MKRISIVAACVFVLAFASGALARQTGDELARRGAIGLGLAPGGEGPPAVSVVRPGGAAARAGIKAGDLLISVGGVAIASQAQLAEAMRANRAGSAITVGIQREGVDQQVGLTLDAAPTEVLDGAKVTYSSVALPAGYRLRTIITEPEKSALAVNGRSPAFLFVQGIYCASLDRPQATTAVDTRLVHAMANAGYVTLRVDKAGLGDSQGPPCSEIDFQTELDGYKAAIRQLASLPAVDPERIYVFGHSMGGLMAPFLSAEVPVRGSIVYGTLARTWFEYQFENARRQLSLGGATESQIAEAVIAEARTSSMILVEKKTMGDVWARYPELKNEGPMVDATHLSSRHMSFYHQLQELNLAKAWEDSRGQVLAIHGEYDWVTSREDHDLIAKIVNARTPNAGAAITLARADHGFTVHESLEKSLAAMGQGAWDGSLPKVVQGWIDGLEGRGTQTPEVAPAAAREDAHTPAAPAGIKSSAAGEAATPVGGQAGASAPVATGAAFPQGWAGHWRGEATSGDGVRVMTFTMELKIGATEKPDAFTWAVIYDGAAGQQERSYTLLVRDAAAGKYAIDEANGIVLDARLLAGTLYSHFTIQGSRITARYALQDAGTEREHLAVELITTVDGSATTTGGQTASVQTWMPASIQRATLRRVIAPSDTPK